MDKQVWVGRLLKDKLIHYLILKRALFFIALYFLILSPTFQNVLHVESLSDFILTFSKRWDGISYTSIADNGYVTTIPERNYIVFPPLYPILIKLLTITGLGSTFSGFIISNIFFILAMIVFYKLLMLDYTKKFALLTISLISIFPTTFFLSIAYPESLFIFLIISSFYFCRKKNYALAIILAALSVVTRPFGIAIFPAIILQIYLQKDLSSKNFLFFGVIFSIPILGYLFINYHLFGNPFMFLIFLKENWQKEFSLPWNGIIASWERGINTQELSNYKFLVGYGEAIASTLAWISVFVGIKHWGIKSSYLLYLVISTILFTSTGFILSAPRYLLSIPPFFIILAKILEGNKFLRVGWIIVSTYLLFYIASEFALGHWTF